MSFLSKIEKITADDSSLRRMLQDAMKSKLQDNDDDERTIDPKKFYVVRVTGGKSGKIVGIYKNMDRAKTRAKERQEKSVKKSKNFEYSLYMAFSGKDLLKEKRLQISWGNFD